jgi:hypothetical protein
MVKVPVIMLLRFPSSGGEGDISALGKKISSCLASVNGTLPLQFARILCKIQ